MSTLRPGSPGATRVCPHCKATVLESAPICPGCRHHLRFNAGAAQTGADDGYCALNIDGSITPKETVEPCEYCVVLDIRNERGEQVVRQVVGVGVLQPGESRRVNLSVDMLPVHAQSSVAKPQMAPLKGSTAPPTPLKPPPQPPQMSLKPPPQPPATFKPVQQPPLRTPGISQSSPATPTNSNDRLRLFRKP